MSSKEQTVADRTASSHATNNKPRSSSATGSFQLLAAEGVQQGQGEGSSHATTNQQQRGGEGGANTTANSKVIDIKLSEHSTESGQRWLHERSRMSPSLLAEEEAGESRRETLEQRESSEDSDGEPLRNPKFLKMETVKFLQSIDQYLKELEINSDKEITADTVVEVLSMRLEPVEATLAKTMLDLKQKKDTNDFLDRVRANPSWIEFNTFVQKLNDLLRQLWIALRKPLYAPIPYELLLNSTLRTEIDVNFQHQDTKFYPNALEEFLHSTEGSKLRQKIEAILENANASTAGTRKSPADKDPAAKSEKQTQLVASSLGKKRILKDIEKPRKLWASELLLLMTTNPDADASETPIDEHDIHFVRKLNERQLLNLQKRFYIACDTFEDCSQELKDELMGMRRRNKLRLLDQIRKDHNTMYLKLAKDKIGFEVEGFVKAPIEEHESSKRAKPVSKMQSQQTMKTDQAD